MNRQVAVGAIEGFWQRLLPSVFQRFHYLLLPKLLPKQVSVLSLIFVPRIRPKKTVSTGQVFSRFYGRL